MRNQPKLILEINDKITLLTDKIGLVGVPTNSQLKLHDHIKALSIV